MNFETHIAEASKTFNYKDTTTDIIHCTLGMMEESGELCGYIKKQIGYGHKLNKVGVLGEIGDYAYYAGMNFHVCEFDSKDNQDLVKRMNLLVTIKQVSKKPVPIDVHARALFKSTATIIAHMEEHNADNVLALYESIYQILNMMCAKLGTNLPAVLDANIAKLRQRHGDKFEEKATYEEGRNRKKEDKLIESRTSKTKSKVKPTKRAKKN